MLHCPQRLKLPLDFAQCRVDILDAALQRIPGLTDAAQGLEAPHVRHVVEHQDQPHSLLQRCRVHLQHLAPAHNGLGIARADQGKLDDAIACYRTAIEFDPKYAPADDGMQQAATPQEGVTYFQREDLLDRPPLIEVEGRPGHWVSATDAADVAI